jgi:hypothetical protein
MLDRCFGKAREQIAIEREEPEAVKVMRQMSTEDLIALVQLADTNAPSTIRSQPKGVLARPAEEPSSRSQRGEPLRHRRHCGRIQSFDRPAKAGDACCLRAERTKSALSPATAEAQLDPPRSVITRFSFRS